MVLISNEVKSLKSSKCEFLYVTIKSHNSFLASKGFPPFGELNGINNSLKSRNSSKFGFIRKSVNVNEKVYHSLAKKFTTLLTN